MRRSADSSDRPEHFFVTGASGALGAFVVDHLLGESVVVTALCDTTDDRCLRLIVEPDRLTALRRVDANSLGRDELHDVLRDVTHVVHTDPTLTSAEDDECAGLARASVERLDDVLRVAHAVGVAGIAFDSSMTVFSPSPALVDAEEAPAPTSAAGCAHLAREMVAARWAAEYGVSSTALRVGVLYGPGHDQGPAGAVARAVAAAMENRPFLLDDQEAIDFQYIADVAAALCDAARTARGFRVANLRCGSTSVGHLVDLLSSFTGATEVATSSARSSDGPCRIAAADSAECASSVALSTSLAAGLRATVESIRWAPRDLAT